MSHVYFPSFHRFRCCRQGPGPVIINPSTLNPSTQGITEPNQGQGQLSKEPTDSKETMKKEKVGVSSEAVLSMYSRESNRPNFHEEDSKPLYHLLTAIHNMLASLGADVNEAADLLQEILHLEDSEFSQTNAPVSYKVHKALEDEELDNHLPTNPSAEVLACSSCMTATIAVVVDALTILLSMLSLSGLGPELEAIVTQMLSDNPSLFNEVEETIPGIADAGSIYDRARAFYKLAKVLYASGMLMRAVKKAISKMPWYKKAYTLATATATIALWFVTDDAAMIAQLVIVLATSTKIFFDAKACNKACKGS